MRPRFSHHRSRRHQRLDVRRIRCRYRRRRLLEPDRGALSGRRPQASLKLELISVRGAFLNFVCVF
jgi:hypothetical protein